MPLALTFDTDPKPWSRQMLTMNERWVDYSKSESKDRLNKITDTAN